MDILVQERLRALRAERHETLEDVCDHVGIMDHGRVLLERSLAQLQDNMVKLQVVFPDGVTEVPAHLCGGRESHPFGSQRPQGGGPTLPPNHRKRFQP